MVPVASSAARRRFAQLGGAAVSSRRAWGLGAVAALLFGACGGDNKGGGPATPSPSAAAPQASATSAAPAGATSAPTAAPQAPGTVKDLPTLPVPSAQVDDNA